MKLCDSTSLFAAVKCRKAVGELLGRLSSQTTIPADVWKLYAEFHLSSEDPTDHDKVRQESKTRIYSKRGELGQLMQ